MTARKWITFASIGACALALFLAAGERTVHGQAKPGSGFAAVPGEKGGWDLTGRFRVIAKKRFERGRGLMTGPSPSGRRHGRVRGEPAEPAQKSFPRR